jgi:hypothetical protein
MEQELVLLREEEEAGVVEEEHPQIAEQEFQKFAEEELVVDSFSEEEEAEVAYLLRLTGFALKPVKLWEEEVEGVK